MIIPRLAGLRLAGIEMFDIMVWTMMCVQQWVLVWVLVLVWVWVWVGGGGGYRSPATVLFRF